MLIATLGSFSKPSNKNGRSILDLLLECVFFGFLVSFGDSGFDIRDLNRSGMSFLIEINGFRSRLLVDQEGPWLDRFLCVFFSFFLFLLFVCGEMERERLREKLIYNPWGSGGSEGLRGAKENHRVYKKSNGNQKVTNKSKNYANSFAF